MITCRGVQNSCPRICGYVIVEFIESILIVWKFLKAGVKIQRFIDPFQ